jgi:hypothetical protein
MHSAVGDLLVFDFRGAPVTGNTIAVGLGDRFKPLVAFDTGGLVRTQPVTAGKKRKQKKDR